MIFFKNSIGALFFLFLMHSIADAQPLHQKKEFTHQDTLLGSNGSGRNWWDVIRYDISIKVDIAAQSIKGYNDITFSVLKKTPDGIMQIDLQEPMEIEKAEDPGTHKPIRFERAGNVFWLYTSDITANKPLQKIRIYFSGKPHVAVKPPWDGGWIWTKDSLGRPWVSSAVQGLGASNWLPCKDYQGDEPDKGVTFSISVPDDLTAVSNGRLTAKTKNEDGSIAWKWTVTQPINTYLITPYIGHYANFNDTIQGEKGKLDIGYWVLDYNLEKAKKHFPEVTKQMLHCFEYWFGPYPFYEDSYKLVDAPHLGMEHQSAIAYGNGYQNGYRGHDLSGTGWGLKWDFIIVHESGHEWFANNITSKDIADMWIHESFTNYSESLFTECQYGKQAGSEYVIGTRRAIRNDIPIIGPYGVNKEGSGDMYYKGGNMLNTIRYIINDDAKFRAILRGLNQTFYHQTVTTKQVEAYIIKQSGKPLQKIFDQYLRTIKVPVLRYTVDGNKVAYKWTNCVDGFAMPVQLENGKWLQPSEKEQQADLSILTDGKLIINPNFFVNVEKAGK
ncbi:MAG: M1 family metallopeptidase [Niabella sp.]|nr:M1 family metallopeptidase [Niabella sp.]